MIALVRGVTRFKTFPQLCNFGTADFCRRSSDSTKYCVKTDRFLNGKRFRTNPRTLGNFCRARCLPHSTSKDHPTHLPEPSVLTGKKKHAISRPFGIMLA